MGTIAGAMLGSTRENRPQISIRNATDDMREKPRGGDGGRLRECDHADKNQVVAQPAPPCINESARAPMDKEPHRHQNPSEGLQSRQSSDGLPSDGARGRRYEQQRYDRVERRSKSRERRRGGLHSRSRSRSQGRSHRHTRSRSRSRSHSSDDEYRHGHHRSRSIRKEGHQPSGRSGHGGGSNRIRSLSPGLGLTGVTRNIAREGVPGRTGHPSVPPGGVKAGIIRKVLPLGLHLLLCALFLCACRSLHHGLFPGSSYNALFLTFLSIHIFKLLPSWMHHKCPHSKNM